MAAEADLLDSVVRFKRRKVWLHIDLAYIAASQSLIHGARSRLAAGKTDGWRTSRPTAESSLRGFPLEDLRMKMLLMSRRKRWGAGVGGEGGRGAGGGVAGEQDGQR